MHINTTHVITGYYLYEQVHRNKCYLVVANRGKKYWNTLLHVYCKSYFHVVIFVYWMVMLKHNPCFHIKLSTTGMFMKVNIKLSLLQLDKIIKSNSLQQGQPGTN